MSNWCVNKLTVEGQPKEILKFLRRILNENEEFDFNNIIAEPQKEFLCPDKYKLKPDMGIKPIAEKPWFNWYKWRLDNWNSLDNANCNCKGITNAVSDGATRISLNFDTTYDPPIPIVRQLTKSFPNLKIVDFYYDTDRMFAGYVNDTEIYEATDEEIDVFVDKIF